MATTKYSFVVCVLITIIGSLHAVHGPGDRLENGTLTFSDDSSMLMIIRKAPANKISHFEFMFRTTVSDCAIVLGESEYGDTSSYSLGLYGGKLRVNSFWHDELNITAGENLNDGKWHKAFVSLNSSHFTLGADGEIISMATPPTEKQSGVNKLHIAFQGRRQHLGSYPSGGCIKNLQINWQRLAVDGAASKNAYKVLMTNVKVGENCDKVEQCRENSCQNGGKCIDIWNAFECKCPRTHHGATCQHPFISAVFNHKDSQNSLAVVDIPAEKVWKTAVISMVLRTTASQGTVFFLGDKSRGMNGNYMEAVISETGKLVVHRKWDSDGGKLESNDYDFVVNDGKARLIQVWCSRDRFEMSMDGLSVSQRAFNTGAFNATVMYIGGIPASLTTGGQNGVAKTMGSKGGGNNLFVPEKDRFIGTIRDVKVRLSLDPAYTDEEDGQSDASKSTLYSVNFFNATQQNTESGRQLGRVTTQNLRMQTLSDQEDYSPCGIEYHCRS